MKKINKRYIFILAGVLVLLAIGIVVSMLLRKQTVFHFNYDVKKPVEDLNITLDENTTVDGKRDETFWNDNTLVFTETKSGVEVTTWAHLGENGLYLFTETDDRSVYWSKEKQFYENDSVEYYIDPRPEYSLQLDALRSDTKVRTDNIQVRIDTMARTETWYGRKTEESYPWVAGDFKVLTAASVTGKTNKKDGASGYTVETFIPWEAVGLKSAPEEIGVMPAFNNVDNREDTSRTWFTVKGMNHAAPTSYARVDKDGFVQIAGGITPKKKLEADWADKAYGDTSILLTEVSQANQNPETRGELKAFLGEEGVYFLVAANDKVLSKGADGIWDNDGIEIIIDTQVKGGDKNFRDGVFRLAVDIDEGIETDICMTGYDDYVAVRRGAFCKTKIREYNGTSAYNYKNTLVYEVMVPYTSMGLTKKPSRLSFAWAVKTPNETSYILNRRNGTGEMEGQDWLWTNRHYPGNPDEYYLLTEKGLEKDYTFSAWTAWDQCKVRSQAPDRYDYRGYASDDGVYINMVQYADKIAYGNVSGAWKDITHVEMELWNGDVGYGWDGTYLAFFPDGSYYINNRVNVTELEHVCTITDRGANYKDGYRYMLSYEIYLGFPNNAGSTDGPYAFVQMMSQTPGESNKGYENAVLIGKDGDRSLWADNCKSYEFRKDGIVARNAGEGGTGNGGQAKPDYAFPEWTAWENCKIRSDAQGRYDYRGFAKDDGVYLNMVQYVDHIAHGGASGIWKDITHIEMELWNGDVGYGWDGTYLAFFPDGSSYINSNLHVTAQEYKCTVTDRGANYTGGYRYMLSYEIYLGFPNNVGSTDGPYAFVKMMSLTPGETQEGYENAVTITKDGDRILWTDDCKSCEFRESGIVRKDTYYNTEAFDAKVAQYKEDWKAKGNAGKTTLFIGDSFFDGIFWSTFYDLYKGKDVLRCGVGSSTSYHWETFTETFLKETSPKNIVMHIGTNNVYDAGKDAKQTIEALQNMFELFHETLPDTKIYYFGITHRSYDDAKIAIVDEVNAAMERWCAGKDYMTFIGGTVKRITSDLLRDNIHPREDAQCNAYEIFVEELSKTDIVIEDLGSGTELLPVEFPETVDFAAIHKDLQSVDPDLYNFQMWTTDNGFYAYFIQRLPKVILDNSDNWKNTHVEMELWNGDVGYGWNGTYIALFPDESVYINNLANVRNVSLQVEQKQTSHSETIMEYYFYLEFDNNTMSYDPSYAYVKQYQFLPGISVKDLNSMTVMRDDRQLVTGDERSFQVHSAIDAKKYD